MEDNIYKFILSLLSEPEPVTGLGSKYDYAEERRGWNEVHGDKYENPHQGVYANKIQDAAHELIGIDTRRPVKKGHYLDISPKDRPGTGTRQNMVCADSACDIFLNANLPWPKDDSGKYSSYINYIEDSFDGIGKPGRLFKEHSKDFKPVKADELATGDILIYNLGGTQKHMVVVTNMYKSGFEAVHDQGHSEGPKQSKYYDWDWVRGGFSKFHKAYRYSPNVNDIAFKSVSES